MKKFILIVTVLCLALSLAACGGGSETGGNASGNTITIPEDTFTFEYKGTKIQFHAEAAPIIAALGEPVKYTESASCAFQGLDKSYYYGSFYLETYPVEDKDYVYGWWFADDSVSTEEGIYIGASQADVEKAYGTDGYNGSNAYTIKRDSGSLTIILKDGVVSSIQYAIKID